MLISVVHNMTQHTPYFAKVGLNFYLCILLKLSAVLLVHLLGHTGCARSSVLLAKRLLKLVPASCRVYQRVSQVEN